MRFGVIRTPMARDTDVSAADYKEIQAAVSKAVADLRERGAEVIDPITIPNLREMVLAGGGGGDTFEAEAAINTFLAQFPGAPVHTLREIVDSPLVIPRRREELGKSLGRTIDDPPAIKQARMREELRDLIVKVVADNRLDALIHATYDHAPAMVPKSTPGTNRLLASITAFPALAVPAGFFADGLPIGIEFLGRPFSEPTLFKAAYGYEKATRHRHPPATAPALAAEAASEVEIHQYGEIDKACKAWTDGCRTCARDASCSNIGIACQPQPIKCIDPAPPAGAVK
jgi:Asp-tRNA(Asn)/Glu-tRNA(Gln) amidotransferase A subunit family amidase